MDIFAHTIWTNLAARKANKILESKRQPKFSIIWATFWGIFPDLFAFSIPFALRIYAVLFGGTLFSNFFQRPPLTEEGGLNPFSIAPNLYPYSHSLIIFSAVFVIVWLIYRRPRFELLGWAIHIVIDIFSHSSMFYPTPFLFPISDFKFLYGIAWSNQWFMITNYSMLLLVWVHSLIRAKKRTV